VTALPVFDFAAFFAAIDAARGERGLGWYDLADELWEQSSELNAELTDHPLCGGAVSRMGARGATSCQYALFMLRWLGRAPEDFLTGPVEHDYFGALGVTAMTTVDTIRGHGTSCPNANDESGYWAPSLHIGGTTFRPTAAHVYYERNTNLPVTAFPAGFHMIVGNAMQMTTDTNNPNIYFGCARSEDNRATSVTVKTCKDGSTNTFAIWLNFPNCWDGKQSSGPSLSLTYSTGSSAKCPSDHPVLLPSVHYTIWYDLPTSQSLSGVSLSSGPMGSAHADFVNGWAPATMATMVKCINTNNRDCS